MQIRALSGFQENTIQQYGRPYTPVGNMTVLGGIGSTDIPKQQVAVKDPNTGKTKLVTVDNINALTSLIQQGFQVASAIRNRRGEQVPAPKRRSRPAPPAPLTAGISKEILIGAAALALFILITKNK